MAVFANFWPVWKNIFTDHHKKNPKLPDSEKEMREEELNSNDYRAACKRCTLYIQKNIDEEEEVPEDLADYYKGEA